MPDKNSTPKETPLPLSRRATWRCAAHEPLVRAVSAIDERTRLTHEIVQRLEKRSDREADRGAHTSGNLAGTSRAIGIMIALGAAIGAIIAGVAAAISLIAGG